MVFLTPQIFSGSEESTERNIDTCTKVSLQSNFIYIFFKPTTKPNTKQTVRQITKYTVNQTAMQTVMQTAMQTAKQTEKHQ